MNEQFQIRLLRLQSDLHSRLRDVRDVRKALVYGLRAAKEVFEAREAAIATLKPGRSMADVIFRIPQETAWDRKLLTEYVAGRRPQITWDYLLAPIRRRERSWAVLALRDKDKEFTADERQALFSVTQILTDIMQAVDEERTRTVRRRIEQKLADRQEPKDLIYDIIHGLRSLTYYDHSASLLISKDGSEALELVAEQIAWTKGKSRRIGLRLGLNDQMSEYLRKGGIHLYERKGTGWQDADGDPDPALPRLIGYCAASGRSAPPEVAMVCAPISTPDGALGMLKISARRRGVLGDYEARLVNEFVPLTSLAVQFSVRTEALHERLLQSERKHALANLTRGITHDVNNALGAMLPLVQQMYQDTSSGRIEPSTLSKDLEYIEKSIMTCRRIFGGMLAIARGSDRGVGHGNLRRAIDGALSVLEDSLKRNSVEVLLDLPPEIPTICGTQGDLTQLFLNVCTNARDAMPKGGLLHITARAEGAAVHVTVKDTGCGIPADVLDMIFEPFYSTKAEGSGLGLSICRSILWDIGGDIRVESEEGEGTRLRLTLPILEEDSREDRE
jgi:two-component system NtrC family sensor kinase